MSQTNPVVVDDLGDDGELAGGRALVDEDDSADLDESLEGGWLLLLRVSVLLVLRSCSPCAFSVSSSQPALPLCLRCRSVDVLPALLHQVRIARHQPRSTSRYRPPLQTPSQAISAWIDRMRRLTGIVISTPSAGFVVGR